MLQARMEAGKLDRIQICEDVVSRLGMVVPGSQLCRRLELVEKNVEGLLQQGC